MKKFIILLLLIISVVFIAGCTSNQRAYDKALELLAEQKYEEALEILQDLNFEDSFEIAEYAREEINKKVLYERAEQFFQDNLYDEAKDIFERLAEQEYRDGRQRVEEMQVYINYTAVIDEYNNKNNFSPEEYRDFYAKFDDFGDFLESLGMLSVIDESFWQDALDDIDYMRLYYTYFPDSERADEAKQLYRNMLIAQAKSELDSASDITGLQMFIRNWSDESLASEFVELAAVKIDEIIIENAKSAFESAKNIRELLAFVNYWRDEPLAAEFVKLASTNIAEMRNNSTISAHILNNPNNATDRMINDFLADYPGHKDETNIKNLFVGDYIELLNSGTIAVSITGNSIDYTTVNIMNNSNRSLTVTIPLGAYFASASASVQNMAVRQPTTTTISAGSSNRVSVASACMNIRRVIPGSNDNFSAAVINNNPRLVRVLNLLNQENASFAVTQAAIWYVTDNPGDYALLNTLVYTGGRRAISQSDLDMAKDIVRRAG